jgi:hypothetical protein
MEVLLLLGAGALLSFVGAALKWRKDAQHMAKILNHRDGREKRWAEDIELALRLPSTEGIDVEDVRESHRETLRSEQGFIDYFTLRYDPKGT